MGNMTETKILDKDTSSSKDYLDIEISIIDK